MRNNYNRLLSVFLFLCFCFKAKAQDVHFSQFFNAPLFTAPSNTGNYTGDWRVMGNYRSQWKEVAKPYTTQSIGADAQYYLFTERFSGGLYIINDKSGGNLKVNKFFASVAYHKRLRKHQVHIGFQPGFVLKNIDYNSETYPNQLNWDNGTFDNSLPNNESGISNQLSYFDINMGGGWDYQFKKITPFVSFSIFHLNRPNESFFGNDNKLKHRNLINLGAYWYLHRKITLAPSILYMTTDKASEFVAGTNVYYSLGKDFSISRALYIGGFVRHGFKNLTDAAVASIGMNYKNYSGGISYDFNISELKAATSYRGAFELSLIYTGISTRLNKTQIPCDRY